MLSLNAIKDDDGKRMRMMTRTLMGGAIGALLLAAQPAQAQIVAMVNGEAITTLDMAQRTKLVQVSTQKTPTRQQVLDELIDDKLKVHLAKRYISEVPKREIEGAFANIARRAGMSVDQFTKMVTASGVSVESLKARIHADFVWAQIIRGKFRSSLQVGDHEVEVKLQGKDDVVPTDYEYSLRPILLLVPRGSGATVMEARKRDADNLRSRFQGCSEGLRLAMSMPDVAVRETIRRVASDLGQTQREALNNTPIGKLTPPDITMQGVELFAVCDKKETKGGESPAKRAAREAMYSERYEALAKKYLKELRSQALIEIR